MGEVFSDYHPIFIGYAGNDNSLMDFLLENSRKFLEDEWSFPYWMLYSKDKIDEKVSDFLTNTEGYLIKHNGFDQVMYLLGAEFDYKLPPKEEFLDDAEKRFQMLSNAIDKFTEISVGRKELKPDGEKQNSETKDTDIDWAIEKITSQTEQQRLYREAVLLEDNGKYEEAMEIKKQLLELEPTNALYHDSLGITLCEMGRYEEAGEEFGIAVELEPTNARYHNNLGKILFEMGRYEEAEEETGKAVELEPSNATYSKNLMLVLRKMGKHEEAEKEEQKAKLLNNEK